MVITYTSPVLTAVAAALLLGEAWGRLDALGSLLCLLGVVLISAWGLTLEAREAVACRQTGLSHASLRLPAQEDAVKGPGGGARGRRDELRSVFVGEGAEGRAPHGLRAARKPRTAFETVKSHPKVVENI